MDLNPLCKVSMAAQDGHLLCEHTYTLVPVIKEMQPMDHPWPPGQLLNQLEVQEGRAGNMRGWSCRMWRRRIAPPLSYRSIIKYLHTGKLVVVFALTRFVGITVAGDGKVAVDNSCLGRGYQYIGLSIAFGWIRCRSVRYGLIWVCTFWGAGGCYLEMAPPITKVNSETVSTSSPTPEPGEGGRVVEWNTDSKAIWTDCF